MKRRCYLKSVYTFRGVVFTLLFMIVFLPGLSVSKSVAKTPYKAPYSDLQRVSPENETVASLGTSFVPVTLNGTVYVIGGDEHEGVDASKDLKSWVKVSTTHDLDSIGHAAVAFKDKIWVIGGAGLNGFQHHTWSSSDGKKWHKSKPIPFAPRTDLGVVVFQDKLWVLGGTGEELESYSDVWCSADGEQWELVTDQAAFGKRDHHIVLAFNNKMWVIGGTVYSSPDDFSPQVWSSGDGKTWQLESADLGCRPMDGQLKAAVFEHRMWLSAWGEKGVTLWRSGGGQIWEEFVPAGRIEEEVVALTPFFNKLYLFVYEGLFYLK